MRTRVLKINGQNRDATLIAGISGLVKVYYIDGSTEPWLYIKRNLFTVQDELKPIVMRFVRLKYMNKNEHEQIIKDFKQLCEVIG